MYTHGTRRRWILSELFGRSTIAEGYITRSGATFKRIKTPDDKDRVYEMTYLLGDEQYFFWMQVRDFLHCFSKFSRCVTLFFSVQSEDVSEDKLHAEKFLEHAGEPSGPNTFKRRNPTEQRPAATRRALEEALSRVSIPDYLLGAIGTRPSTTAPVEGTASSSTTATESTPLLFECKEMEIASDAVTPATTATDDTALGQEFEGMDPEEAEMLAEAIRLSQQPSDSNDASNSENNNNS